MIKSISCHSSQHLYPMRPHAFVQACGRSISQLLNKRPCISQLHQIHAHIIAQCLASSYPSLSDSLIHCYLHAEHLDSARKLFNSYPLQSPSTLLWNLMIRAYSKIQDSSEPINLFHQMLNTQAVPDKFTFNFLITSCVHQKSVVYGEIVHGTVIKNGCLLNLNVANSLINMYANFGLVDSASQMFDEISVKDVFSWTSLVSAYVKKGNMRKAGIFFSDMPVRNDVSWAVMISGFVNCGMYSEALIYFRRMLCEMNPNEAVLVCALSACARLGAIDQGDWILGHIDKSRIPETSNIRTALIDMYAKCGRIDCAYRVFYKIPRRDVHNFTSMISGLSIHGLGEEAISVFQQMLTEKLKPNGITILSVLNGCSHSGLVPQGSSIFYNMERYWGIVPKIEHYGCYVDLLGRAGYLAKAFGVVKSMPMNPDFALWRSLLSACRIYRNASFGERIINHLEQFDPRNSSGADVPLSNLYVSVGKWEEVTVLRKVMNKQRNQSDTGCSWIEVNGVVHEFRVADVLHPQIVEIKDRLSEIMKRVSLAGYAADSSRVSFDLSEEDKEQAVGLHSEKLAIAFALMNISAPASIRIVKNLRTCEDCHRALKLVSKIYEREIIFRDRSRFHTFSEGNCSCKDYW